MSPTCASAGAIRISTLPTILARPESTRCPSDAATDLAAVSRFSNFDLGVAKHFPIRENLQLEFRADAYNVFNHVNFNFPGVVGNVGTADITDPTQFGVITTAAPSRQMQFALRLDF
jgi:hypothetical protein